MASPLAVDEIAAAAGLDFIRLAEAWHSGGDAALDALVRNDPELAFAYRPLAEGRHLLVMRATSPPDEIMIDGADPARGYGTGYHVRGGSRRRINVAFGFLHTAGGDRWVIARSEAGLRLVASPDLADVRMCPLDDPLAETLGGFLGVGLDRRIDLPAGIDDWTPADEIGLLNVIDVAARVIGGRLRIAAAVQAIALERCTCGLGERDPDISAAYAIDSCMPGYEQFRWNKERAPGAWTWADEIANAEAFYGPRVNEICRSLLQRFRVPGMTIG